MSFWVYEGVTAGCVACGAAAVPSLPLSLSRTGKRSSSLAKLIWA